MSYDYSPSMSTSTSSPNILKRQRSPSPQNVVVILPDESCFAYATPEPKKARAEGKNRPERSGGAASFVKSFSSGIHQI
jgi:hypothetical protein